MTTDPLYLVTGGAGFIGSNLVHALVADGCRVRVLDSFATGLRENLDGLPEDLCEVVEGSILDPEALEASVAGVSFVVHLAALPSVPRSVADPVASHEANASGTLAVLQAARAELRRRGGAPGLRVVAASSSSVYGGVRELPWTETMPPAPLSPYAASKLAGEAYVRAFDAAMDVPGVALRFFNVFGPRQRPDGAYAAVIPRWVAAGLRGEPATIYGDGRQSRDFCPVANVVHAVRRCCAVAPVALGRAYNVALGERRNLLELARLVRAELEDLGVEAPPPVHEAVRPGDVRHSRADLYEAQRCLGYSPPVSFEAGLREAVRWYVERERKSWPLGSTYETLGP